MRVSGSRSDSPPATYAKYLNDFEECDEAQAIGQNLDRNALAACKASSSQKRSQRELNHWLYSQNAVASSSSGLDRSSNGLRGHTSSGMGSCRSRGSFPEGSSSHESIRAIGSSSHREMDRARSSSSREQSIVSRSKSIYDSRQRQRSTKQPSKTCHSFTKFGDSQYRNSCEIPHDIRKLNGHSSRQSTTIDEINSSYASCRELEKRLQQIKHELHMLDEEERKPKSSVVIPKHTPQTIFGGNSKAFNVGGDFIVKIGNSCTKRRETDSERDGDDRHRFHSSSKDSKEKRAERSDSCSDRGSRRRSEDTIAKKCSRNERFGSVLKKRKPYDFKSDMSSVEMNGEGRHTRSRNIKDNLSMKYNFDETNEIESKELDVLVADPVSDSSDEKDDVTQLPKDSSKSLLPVAISDESELDETGSFIDEDGGELSLVSEDGLDNCQSSRNEKNKDKITAIDPDHFIDISDEEIVFESEDYQGPCTSSAKQPATFREGLTFPYVFRDCPIITKSLSREMQLKLRQNGFVGEHYMKFIGDNNQGESTNKL